jgi:hypothetical protein
MYHYRLLCGKWELPRRAIYGRISSLFLNAHGQTQGRRAAAHTLRWAAEWSQRDHFHHNTPGDLQREQIGLHAGMGWYRIGPALQSRTKELQP